MDNEGKNGAQTDKQAVLGRLRDTKALYVVVSACTKLPYVVCDPETFDDEVLVFFKPEEAEAKAKSLAGEKIPVSIVKLENKQLLLFYTNLYTMGVNAIFVADSGKEELIQLEEFVRRRGDEPGEEDKVWVENPALHLTALYYMQEARRQPGPEMNSRLMELQVCEKVRLPCCLNLLFGYAGHRAGTEFLFIVPCLLSVMKKGAQRRLTAVQVMVDLGTVITVHCCRGIIQRRQQVCLDIADFCSVLVNTVKDILQVAGIDLQETALYHLPGKIIPGDTDIWTFG